MFPHRSVPVPVCKTCIKVRLWDFGAFWVVRIDSVVLRFSELTYREKKTKKKRRWDFSSVEEEADTVDEDGGCRVLSPHI